MVYKRVLAALLTGAMVLSLCSCASSSSGTSSEEGTQSASAESEETEETESQAALEDGEVALEVSSFANPIAGFDEDGELTYGGDPSVLVDGDTVYLYLGHDTSTDDSYVMPDYICYSSTDLVNWTYEGSVFTANKVLVEWLNTSTSAWASQVVKHYDEEAGQDMYYLYYCSWDATSDGKQSIGVAVSDSPTGLFEDIGEPLVSGNVTIDDETSTWNDIDPTVWIETDDDGEEHIYLAWGNGRCYVCELNEDMVSVKDQNGDGEITSGASTDVADIIESTDGLTSYTEAPWLYRRQDEDGNYYGDYYLFYAYSWRECLAYATTDDLLDGTWTFGSVIMRNSATANTEHPAVFDFQGKTYLISHNGALPGGDGYRRSPIILEIEWNDDGTIDLLKELTASIAGTASTITLADGSTVGHAHLYNSASDDRYPYTDVACGIYELLQEPEDEYELEAEDMQWVICAGKADTSNAAYVSIQSQNKNGLYMTANEDMTVTLAQEDTISTATEEAQTFHTVVGLADEDGVSFESVAYPGYYLTIVDDELVLTDGSDAENATFYVDAVV